VAEQSPEPIGSCGSRARLLTGALLSLRPKAQRPTRPPRERVEATENGCPNQASDRVVEDQPSDRTEEDGATEAVPNGMPEREVCQRVWSRCHDRMLPGMERVRRGVTLGKVV
jgi:hypothetical protein